MSKGTTAAERLGHPRRCSARRKRTGEPCGAWAIKGGNVCRIHGGMAPQTQAKAKQRLDLQTVRDAVRRLRGHDPVPYVPLPELDQPATEATTALGVPENPADPDAENPAETASHSPADGPVDPPTADGPETAPASPSGPSTPVPPGTGLMSLEEAVSRTRPNQAFATGRIPAARRGRRR